MLCQVVSDIADAVAYMKRAALVDEDRVYLIGGSGGGHASAPPVKTPIGTLSAACRAVKVDNILGFAKCSCIGYGSKNVRIR